MKPRGCQAHGLLCVLWVACAPQCGVMISQVGELPVKRCCRSCIHTHLSVKNAQGEENRVAVAFCFLRYVGFVCGNHNGNQKLSLGVSDSIGQVLFHPAPDHSADAGPNG